MLRLLLDQLTIGNGREKRKCTSLLAWRLSLAETGERPLILRINNDARRRTVFDGITRTQTNGDVVIPDKEAEENRVNPSVDRARHSPEPT